MKGVSLKLIEGGMSQRQAAKVLGVDQRTIQRDVRQSASKTEAESLTTSAKTGSDETKARRAAVAAKAQRSPELFFIF